MQDSPRRETRFGLCGLLQRRAPGLFLRRAPWLLALLLGLGGSMPASPAALRAIPARSAAAAALADWTLTWDDERGELRAAWRRRAPTLAKGASMQAGLDEARATRRASAFLDAHADLLGIDPQQLGPAQVHRAGRLTHVRLPQERDGLPVEGAGLLLSLRADGEPLLLRSSLVSVALPALTPGLRAPEAGAAAQRTLGESLLVRDALLVILPRNRAGTPGDHFAWRLRVQGAEREGTSLVWIDAHSGALLARRSLVHRLRPDQTPAGTRAAAAAPLPNRDPVPPAGPTGSGHEDSARRAAAPRSADGDPAPSRAAQLTGVVVGEISDPDPWGIARMVPFPHATVSAYADSVQLASGFTDASGTFDLGEETVPAVRLTTRLAGRFAVLHRHDRARHPALLESEMADTLAWDSTPARAAEREAYITANRIHDRWHALDPSSGAPAGPLAPLDEPIPLVVEDTLIACNAFAYGDPEDPWLRFSAAGNGCTSLGRLTSVVYHEYGHLLTTFAYWPAEAPAPLREGFADFFAASVADTPYIGLGWRGPGTYLRCLTHDIAAPLSPQCAWDPHCEGLLIAGALWDLREALIAAAGDRSAGIAQAEHLFHAMRLGQPADYDECLWLLLYEDDDDGDLSNGTPHLSAIAASFARHGIGTFAPHLDHTPLVDQALAGASRPVCLEVTSLYPVAAEGARLHYRNAASIFTSFPLAAETAGREAGMTTFCGLLPGQEAETTVHYYFTLRDEGGREATLPPGAPAAFFDYRVGTDETAPTVRHRPLSVVTSDATGFWVQAEIEDNAGAIAGALIEAYLAEMPARGRGTWTLMPKLPGTSVYEAWVPLGLVSPGETIHYRMQASDLPPRSNQACFPPSGTLSVAVREGWNWDCESEETELDLSTGWRRERISAADDPRFPAPSGSYLLRAVPESLSAPADTAHLTLPLLDLSGWSAAQLEFASWSEIPDLLPGGVFARASGSETWQPLWSWFPARAAPAPETASGSWSWPVFSLDAYVDQAVELRFSLPGNPGAEGTAWALDDLRVVAAPALAPPENLTAGEGTDECVALGWEAPDTNGEGSDLLGYHLYRGDAPSNYDREPLGGELIATPSWVDRDVINGRRYYYAASAVYARGESPLSAEVGGCPYAGAIAAPAEIDTDLGEATTGADTLLIENAGSGPLAMSFYAGREDDAWQDLFATLPLDGSALWSFVTVATDPADAAAPDLRDLAFKEIAGRLALRIRFHGPLPDPTRDFTLVVLLDTDFSRETGFPGEAVGAERLLILGSRIYEATQGTTTGYILDSDLEYLAVPAGLILHAGLDSLEVAIPLSLLGSPDSIACEIQVELEGDGATNSQTMRSNSDPLDFLRHRLGRDNPTLSGSEESEGTAGDRLPDAPRVPWLEISSPAGRAAPGAPYPLVLSYAFDPAERGLAEARLFVHSNDQATPLVTIPLRISLADPDPPRRLTLGRPAPNPFAAETHLILALPPGAAWRVEIFDVTGRLVRRLGGGVAEGGSEPLIWNGRDDAGRRLASGCYYARASGGGVCVTRTLVLIH
ncbi:MAG: hypothetical protein KAY32_04790 [Candidatus Eisenbacteria sp.]|nr:hypothetical protein [Candidatus Eisenbacteria bacterium]